MSFTSKLRREIYGPQGYAEILRVGLPLAASMASATVMQFTDRLFLSHYSVDAIAAAMPASIASLTIMLTFMGICGYTTVLIAQYVGSGAPHRVGVALWQGLWCALAASIALVGICFLAEPLFALAGHDEAVQKLEVEYFVVLTAGSGFALFGAVVGAFFSGRGQTRMIMVANTLAAIINVPLDYLFIFGGFGIPSMGIFGAGIATTIGWIFCFVILTRYTFTAENEEYYRVRSSWRIDKEMLKRLLRFGFPSGVNLFIELIASTWFIFEVGGLGRVALAASNIAFSINSLVFTPMLGLNMAIAALVGQAMGRQKPLEAEAYTKRTLILAFSYMVPICMLFFLFPQFFIGLFAPGSVPAAEFAPIASTGVILLYYIAVYSLVDASSIILFGALKGAGDTLGLMRLLFFAMLLFLVLPIGIMKYLGIITLHRYWIAFTIYVVFLAGGAFYRFRQRRWHNIRVVETV